MAPAAIPPCRCSQRGMFQARIRRALTARIGAREAVGRMSPGELILVSVDDHVAEAYDQLAAALES